MDTLEGGQEAEAGATVLLLPALLPALEPTLILALVPIPGVTAKS